MSAAIIDGVLQQYAPEMLNYASLITKVAKTLMSKEARLHKKATEIAGSVYKRHHHAVEIMGMDDLEKIEMMGRLIVYDTELMVHGVSKTEPLSKTVDAPYRGRQKRIAYSKEKIKAQALLLRGVRHTHARKTAVLIRTIGTLVKRMKKLESKAMQAMRKALRTAGEKADSLEGMGFEVDTPTFEWVLGRVDEALGDAQAVANASVPLPAE